MTSDTSDTSDRGTAEATQPTTRATTPNGTNRPHWQLPWWYRQVIKPLAIGLAFLHVAAKLTLTSPSIGATVPEGAVPALRRLSEVAMLGLVGVAFLGCWVLGLAGIRYLQARRVRRI